MKHRARSSKIKYEHDMIAGLRELLESIEDWEEIMSIIPAEIKPIKTRDKGLKVQYATATGIKCLYRASGAVQEVFITTKHGLIVQEKLLALFRAGR